MPIFVLQDERTTSELIPSDHSVLVRAGDNMIDVLAGLDEQMRLRTFGQAWGSELHIVCHGFPQGLQLGRGFVHHDNVGMFTLIRNTVGTILVHGCSAALSYPNGCNGILMCSRMAVAARAYVTASDTTQGILPASYSANTTGRTYLQHWRGRVGTWDMRGAFITGNRAVLGVL